ncbi:MAG: hypothetical protein C0597_05065 [Marinilabiliales bacterium]|nr:MAG: hypothetical protein C0597_05065 [Marinilabiliales bacterium]
MIATYIQELLATNNRVIVPNYGAFLVRATSKSKDASTLEEKLKDIYFSPFLKFNDELLEKYIIKKEGVTKEQAAEKIKQFIDDVKKELELEKPYVIKDFGHFEADKQGKVQFIPVVKESVKPKAVAEKTSTTKTAAKKTPVAKETVKAKEEKKQEEKPKASETKAASPEKKEVKQEIKLEEFKEEKKEPASVTTEKAKEKTPSAQAKPIYSYKKEKTPINKGLVWSVAIGLPLAAIFIWALLNFNTVKKVFNKEKAKTEKVTQKKTTKISEQTTKKSSEQVKKETTAKTETKEPVAKKPASPQKKYYIIAGSFKNEKYAVSYMNKLKAEGYNAEKLAERNGMHAVSFNSFTDKRKAIAEYKFLAQEKGLQAWILYY